MVSESRFAGPPHCGHATLTQSVAAASGEVPFGRDQYPSGMAAQQVADHRAPAPPTSVAVDDRYRATPVALPTQQPVPQPEITAPSPTPSASSLAVIARIPAPFAVRPFRMSELM